jgi:5,10-methylenetetrahydromethanopterin reductase
MGQVGSRAASPLTLLREHAEALRLLLDGHEVTVTGRCVSLDRVPSGR